MFITQKNLKEFDPELWSSINNETSRQEEHIELIASENYTSKSILEVQGSVLTNKYAEGYPGKRYYGGCEHVDVAESLAIDRAKELYGAAYANVQPHSGASANSAVYLALCEAGDSILGMSLDHGGHLTDGAKVNFSGKTYESFQYGLDPSTGEMVLTIGSGHGLSAPSTHTPTSACLLYTSPSPRDRTRSRMPSSA